VALSLSKKKGEEMKAYKLFTHDLRSPIQGGRPVWDGAMPYQLPVVPVDSGADECGAGWNACAHASDALRIAGLWPDGWPARLFAVEAPRGAVVERGDKLRAATWVVTAEICDLRPPLEELTRNIFRAGDLCAELVDEQLAWHTALGRPIHDAAVVEEGLRDALMVRGLQWKLKKFDAALDAWAARAARAALAASAAWDAWDSWASSSARAARAAWAAWDSWNIRSASAASAASAAWAARSASSASAARVASSARVALTVYYAARCGGVDFPANLLSRGLRDAYLRGLALAIPTGPNELGWAMVGSEEH
jgi:hypothetical protein